MLKIKNSSFILRLSILLNIILIIVLIYYFINKSNIKNESQVLISNATKCRF